MNTTEEILKYRRSGKSIQWIKDKYGFKSDGSVYHHLNKAKLRAVYLTEGEVLVLRRLLTELVGKPPSSEFVAEALWNINEALKLAGRKQ